MGKKQVMGKPKFKRLLFHLFNSIKVKFIIPFILLSIILYYFGAFTHMFELNYYEKFDYPLRGDIQDHIMRLRNNLKPAVAPINSYNYSFLSNCEEKCKSDDQLEHLQLVYIIKSAADHFDRRHAIRNSWGFQGRFSDVPIRTVFILGVRPNDSDPLLQSKIEEEQRKFKDIVQANFFDTYFNNTIKTMIGFKWAVTWCHTSKFYMFNDDDMYVSTKNVLRFVRNPTNYPKYLEDPVFTLNQKKSAPKKRSIPDADDPYETTDKLKGSRQLQQVLDFELDDEVRLFTGFVFESAPHRHQSSKWHVSLQEYPYHMWPPYVTAGAYILSREALLDMYYGSFYTQHFRFDDIYLGLIAKKVDIEPYHSDEFHFYKKKYDVFGYRYLIASHGYSDPKELIQVWNEQKSAGNA